MIRKLAFVTAAAVLGAALVSASADVTFVLKNGDRVSGQLVYRHTADFTVVRDGREQTYPSDNIALIQFTGGDPSRNELEQLPNVDHNPNELERHVFVFRNGNIMRGKLHDIVDNWFDFDAQQGGRRKHDLSELARLYFNPASARRVYNFDSRPNEQSSGAGSGGEIRVEANQAWTSTGINVNRGERIAFEASGDIKIGPNVSAGLGGNPDLARRMSYPVRSMAAGGLIGRVGNGAPFPIGSNREAIVMPAAGELRLGVNDDRFTDNSGWFTVRVIRSAAAPNRRIR
ncbi:MAG TPA: hypothetical protein VES67_14285 [Vicinamibacterales bacterium]|nr:hypothetical protein [Vicinamibacterales bacterium]